MKCALRILLFKLARYVVSSYYIKLIFINSTGMTIIIAASYTYYRTLNSEDSLKQRGKHEERKTNRRRRERLLRVSHHKHLKGLCMGPYRIAQ